MDLAKETFTSTTTSSPLASAFLADDHAMLRRAESLARSLVCLASNGNDGSLFSRLNTLEGQQGLRAIRETIYLYVYLVSRAANALVDPDETNSALRDAFLRRLRAETVDLLMQTDQTCFDEEVYRADFQTACDEHVAAYNACTQLYWQSQPSTKGTVMYEFFRRLTPLGHEVAVAVIANLQIATLESECASALGTHRFTFPIAG